MRRVDTAGAPAAGAYSAAVATAGLLFTSGQLGRDPAGGELREGVDAQVEQCFERLAAVCEAAGARLADAVRATVYATDLARARDAVDRAFAQRFGAAGPARTMVGVAELPGGGLVEIDLVVALEAGGG